MRDTWTGCLPHALDRGQGVDLQPRYKPLPGNRTGDPVSGSWRSHHCTASQGLGFSLRTFAGAAEARRVKVRVRHGPRGEEEAPTGDENLPRDQAGRGEHGPRAADVSGGRGLETVSQEGEWLEIRRTGSLRRKVGPVTAGQPRAPSVVGTWRRPLRAVLPPARIWLSTCRPRAFVPAGAAAGCRPCSAEEHAGIGVLTADTGGTVPGGGWPQACGQPRPGGKESGSSHSPGV